MEFLLALIGMAIVLFTSTKVDDVFVLVGFFVDKNFRTRDIVLGQYAGITALFSTSMAASLLSLGIPRAYIGLLGVIPILIGGKKLFELYRQRDRTEESLEHHSDAKGNGRIATVALVTLANGGDNIGIYTPSFAICSAHEIIVIALIFVVMTALWCFVAHKRGKARCQHQKRPCRRDQRNGAKSLLLWIKPEYQRIFCPTAMRLCRWNVKPELLDLFHTLHQFHDFDVKRTGERLQRS